MRRRPHGPLNGRAPPLKPIRRNLNYLVHGAWYRDHLNPAGRDTDVLRKTMLLLLHQAFPRHFDLMP
ncbi:hypothetical protein [Mesorhizobium erdmanii]|uniref:hypothetical protein n=1 Tax=Mesorhizobium erdmanii TaxID=1777866 RepID=UPI0003F95641|nr:hypothetical protein [Mesorhizobium erdmanii]